MFRQASAVLIVLWTHCKSASAEGEGCYELETEKMTRVAMRQRTRKFLGFASFLVGWKLSAGRFCVTFSY